VTETKFNEDVLNFIKYGSKYESVKPIQQGAERAQQGNLSVSNLV
jgi:hypothetical protein